MPAVKADNVLSPTTSLAEPPRNDAANVFWYQEEIDGSYYYYTYLGEYPQTYVGNPLNAELESEWEKQKDRTTISRLLPTGKTFSIGYNHYLADELSFDEYSYNGSKYARIHESTRSGRSTSIPAMFCDRFPFLNGEQPTDDTIWFKVEPIKWYAFDKTNPLAYNEQTDIKVISQIALASQISYDLDSRNYEQGKGGWENSYIRQWTQQNFIKEAELESLLGSVIKRETVVNQGYDANVDDESGVPTNDYVYLPSYNEMQMYGYQSDCYTHLNELGASPSDFAMYYCYPDMMLNEFADTHYRPTAVCSVITYLRSISHDYVFAVVPGHSMQEIDEPWIAFCSFRPMMTINFCPNTGGNIQWTQTTTPSGGDFYYTTLGEYPQTYVGDQLNGLLEKNLGNDSVVTPTGKSYSIPPNDYYEDTAAKDPEAVEVKEYYYAGEKFARLSKPFTYQKAPFYNPDDPYDNTFYPENDYKDVLWFKVEPIKWFIIDGTNPFLLTQSKPIRVISELALVGVVGFDMNYEGDGWENSTMRSWMNSGFLSETGLANYAGNLISLQTNMNDNDGEMIDNDPATQDYLYPLSWHEMFEVYSPEDGEVHENLFLSASMGDEYISRAASPSDFALATGGMIGAKTITSYRNLTVYGYWLRNFYKSSRNNSEAYFVECDGTESDNYAYDGHHITVRPAMTISYSPSGSHALHWGTEVIDGYNFYFTYLGSYPQTYVGDETNEILEQEYQKYSEGLTSSLKVSERNPVYTLYQNSITNEEDYECFAYKGSDYVRVYNFAWVPSEYSTGDSNTNFEYCWFKVEPIKWWIFDDTNPFELTSPTKIKVIADQTLLSGRPFSETETNKWPDSDLYKWANGRISSNSFIDASGLYEYAFDHDKTLISDNSDFNDPTFDDDIYGSYIYLPSVTEVKISLDQYSSKRIPSFLQLNVDRRFVSDLTLASGGYIRNGTTVIWTRTCSNTVAVLDHTGKITDASPDENKEIAFRPMMTLNYDPYVDVEDFVQENDYDNPDIYREGKTYHVKSYDGLKLLSQYSNLGYSFENTKIVLDNNIVCTGHDVFPAIENIGGCEFDGNGYSIIGLNAKGGLFGVINQGETVKVRNLQLLDLHVYGKDLQETIWDRYAGGLFQIVFKDATIELSNVYVELKQIGEATQSDSSSSTASYAGGLIGFVDSTAVLNLTQVEVYADGIFAPEFGIVARERSEASNWTMNDCAFVVVAQDKLLDSTYKTMEESITNLLKNGNLCQGVRVISLNPELPVNETIEGFDQSLWTTGIINDSIPTLKWKLLATISGRVER